VQAGSARRGDPSGRIQRARRCRTYARVRGRWGTFGATIQNFQKPLQENPTHLRCRLPEPIVIPEPPFAFVGLTGVARDIARAIAATAEGGPRRLRVNPALHTELSGVRGDKTHLLVIASQNGNRENSVYLRINLKMTMLRGAPVRGAPTF
jgi:hypothetical protein